MKKGPGEGLFSRRIDPVILPEWLASDHFPLQDHIPLVLIDELQLVHHALTDTAGEQVLALFRGEFEDLVGQLEPANHFLIAQTGLVHGDYFIQGDKAILVNVSCWSCQRFFRCGRTCLGAMHRCFSRFAVLNIFQVGADQVTAASPQSASEQGAQDPMAFATHRGACGSASDSSNDSGLLPFFSWQLGASKQAAGQEPNHQCFTR
jgi:hypothetical protein